MRLIMLTAVLYVAAMLGSPTAMAEQLQCWGLQNQAQVYELGGHPVDPRSCGLTLETNPMLCNVYNGRYFFYSFEAMLYVRVPTNNKFCLGLRQLDKPLIPGPLVGTPEGPTPKIVTPNTIKLSLLYRLKGKCRGCSNTVQAYNDGFHSN